MKMWRYFIWLIAVFGLIIILIILLTPSGKKLPTARSLYSYANTGAVARLTIDGPINSDELHQSVQINVDQYSVTYDQYQGYQGHVIKQLTFPNNEPAYNAFLHALYHSGFTEGNTSSSLQDEEGYCALGDRFIYEFIDGSTEVERFWSTSCNNTKTFKGDSGLTIDLFRSQVPNYSEITNNLNL